MKKYLFSTIALATAFAANAEYLEVHHTTSSNLKTELEAAIAAAGITDSDVTELKIISDLDDNGSPVPLHIYSWGGTEDCAALRVHFRPSNNPTAQLKKVDFSEAVFQDNATGTPGSQGDFLSYISTLEEVILPESVVSLCGAFYGCTNLTKVNLENITTFGKGALAGCTKLVIKELPKDLKKIYANAFEHEKQGKPSFQFPAGYELPESIEMIGDATFKGWNVAWTKLPANLEEVGAEAFQDTKCTFSELPSTLKIIGKAAFRAAPVTFSYLPESVESVAADAFIMCTSITNFDLTGIFETEIPDRVFYLGSKVTRTFTSRAAKAPKVTLMSAGSFAGSFGRDADVFGATTIRYLKDAESTFEGKEPWNQMKREILTTPVSIDVPDHITLEHQHHGVIEGSTDIYEGSHEWTITPANGYYITSIRYDESTPARMENFRTDDEEDEIGNEETEEPEETEADPAELYTVDPSLDNDALGELSGMAQKVTVPVTTRPGTLKVETKQWIETGVEAVAAAPAFTRHGNIITVSEGTATVYDLTGKAIVTAADIDLSTLSTGVYILRAGATAMKLAL